ncbi:integral membrane protein [Xylogone sp. PMI_703]|nr:integral membrane protein [Xylogone sp. PMI_703]
MMTDPNERLVFVALISIALFNTLEVFVHIFFRFKKYHGTYFWSLLLTAAGIVVSATGNLLVYFSVNPPVWGFISIGVIGWWFYITFQSLILWSRLYLVLPNQRVLCSILWMIIINSIAFIIPTTVLVFLQSIQNARHAFTNGYLVMEIIQVTGFFIQELIISGLYMWKSIQLSKLIVERQKEIILYQVFAMNVGIIFLDFAILIPQFLHQRETQIMIKSVVYSIKLKFELIVLSKMADFCTVSHTDGGNLLITETHTLQHRHSNYKQECGVQHSSSNSSAPTSAEWPALDDFPQSRGRPYIPGSLSLPLT